MTRTDTDTDCDTKRAQRKQAELQSHQGSHEQPSDEQAVDAADYSHQCYICDKTFSANSNLNRHLRKVHQETVQSPYNNVKCALCKSQHPSSPLYIRHLEQEHQITIEVAQLRFNTKQEFEEWKHEIESQTTSQFIKSRGQKQSKNVNKTYYSCNRSGCFISKARTQKALKKQGSRKINGRCPASMNVTVDRDFSYHVRFISTHVGHDHELKHLDLSEKDRDLIVCKLTSGITKRDIIKQIRTTSELHQNTYLATTNSSSHSTDASPSCSTSSIAISNLSGVQPIIINSRSSMPGCGEQQIEVVLPRSDGSDTVNLKSNEISVFNEQKGKSWPLDVKTLKTYGKQQISPASTNSRLHLATSKDIHNILNSKRLDSKKIRLNYDLNTLEDWIGEMIGMREESSTVLFYKDQDKPDQKYEKLRLDDFVLVIMKDGQAEALKKWARRCIVIDSTYNVNCEYLHLTYLSVIDDTNKGFPVAFMFSTRTDVHTLEVFYTLIRDKVGQISTRTLIADELNDFYQVWWKIMSRPLHNLPAPWSVMNSWSAKYDLIKSREKLRKIKKQLRELLTETETEKFNRSLKRFLADNKEDPETDEFMDYFEKQFAKNPDVWSSCLHTASGISNLTLMKMHERFKKIYKEGKTSKKMCKYITCLMQLFEDDQMLVMLQFEQADRVAKRRGNLSRHHKGVAFGSSVYELAVDPVYWLCPSKCSTDVYDEVRQNIDSQISSEQNSRKCCDLVCPECKACRHQYKCTCLDYVVNLNMCKHIHRISALCNQE